MKGAPVLHWPKLFEGKVWAEREYWERGDGDGYSSDGDGDGYGDGYSSGYSSGYGRGNGFGGSKNDTKGGGGYALTNGNGWSRRSV